MAGGGSNYTFNPQTGSFSLPSGASSGNTTLGAYQNQLNTAPQDYRSILAGYGNQMGQSVFNNPNVSQSLNTLSGAADTAQQFTQTGGYSPGDLSELRARAISPIRSIYANAQNDINRQRNLQGGYSPNYTAATAKMARDMSSQISDQSTNVEAQIAQMLQQGKLQGLGQLGSIAGQQASTTGSLATGDLTRALQALSGMTSIYGASPGLLGTLGNQSLEAQQIANQQQNVVDQLNNQNQLQQLAAIARGI